MIGLNPSSLACCERDRTRLHLCHSQTPTHHHKSRRQEHDPSLLRLDHFIFRFSFFERSRTASRHNLELSREIPFDTPTPNPTIFRCAVQRYSCRSIQQPTIQRDFRSTIQRYSSQWQIVVPHFPLFHFRAVPQIQPFLKCSTNFSQTILMRRMN